MKTKSMDITLVCSKLLSLETLTASSKQKFAASLAMDPGQMIDYLRPKADDYIHVPIRALSAAAVQNNTINFSYKGGQALKESVNRFNDLVVLKDHNMSVDNWLGRTSGAYWDEGTSDTPPGVNMMLDVDTKADPKVARGLISQALDSGSVTVRFDYDQSHPEMDEIDFLCCLGTVVDDKTVQALVTKITRLFEYSVVWQGADEFAKVQKEGLEQQHKSLSHSFTQEDSVDIKKLAILLGLSLGDAPTEESFETAIKSQGINVAAFATAQTELVNAQTQLTTAKSELALSEIKVTELTAAVTSLTTDLATTKTQNTELTSKVDGLTINAALGLKMVADNRNEALRLYNLVEGSKATSAMQALIANATLEVSQSFVVSYRDRAEQIAPIQCVDCGSTNLSRGKAKQNELPDVGTHAFSTMETERRKSTLAFMHGK